MLRPSVALTAAAARQTALSASMMAAHSSASAWVGGSSGWAFRNVTKCHRKERRKLVADSGRGGGAAGWSQMQHSVMHETDRTWEGGEYRYGELREYRKERRKRREDGRNNRRHCVN